MENASKILYLFPPDKPNENEKKKEEKDLPRLGLFRPAFTPCLMGSTKRVKAVNKGGESKGIAVEFIGDYLENDDIVIENIVIEQGFGADGTKEIPIAMEKRTYSDGQCILYWEDEDFPIPPGVYQGLPRESFCRMQLERSFGIRFTPKGNPRKTLDIIAAIIPIENAKREASAVWYAWKNHDSKESYIKSRNAEIMERIINCGREDEAERRILKSLLLDPENFDL